ncbi:MAG: hypothetical protein J1E57_01135 [Prevotella sp.]|nr:hypothetical protein [Prevotella sp.]
MLLFAVARGNAQVMVEARIDSVQIMMGDQAHLTLTVVAKEGADIVFPMYKPTEQIVPGVEVLDISEVATRDTADNLVQYSRRYTLTSFDGSNYYLPPMTVKVDGKKYNTKNLALKVIDVDVDTLHYEKFFPAKDVQDNPFLWAEWALAFWLSVIVVLLMSGVIYLYSRLRQGKTINLKVKIVKRLMPHQKALKEINEIKAENMVHQEDQKEYYTRLTDTLRRYMEERYGFNAMEMTSSEIIARLTAEQDAKALEELRMLFNTADLVKFAKYSTLINENDMNLVNAIEFINRTKIENMPTEQVIKPELTAEDERKVKERKIMKIAIWSMTAVAVILTAYIIYNVYGICQ